MADRATIALALGQTLAWAGLYYAFPATLLRWEAEAGWSRVDLTGAMSLAVLVSALAAPVAGRIIDAGRGPAMMVGAAVLGGALMACLSQVHSLGAFYGIWAGIGLAMAGCLYEPCFAMVTRARGAQARGAITVITLVAGFAGTVSFPSLHALVEAYGLRSALVWAGVGVIALAAPLLWIGARGLGAGVADPVDHSAPAERGFLRRPVFWLLAVSMSLIAVAHGGVIHHFLPLLDERGVSPDLAVLAAASIGPMQVAGRLAMATTARWASLNGVALAAFAAIVAAMILLRLGGTSGATIAGFVLLFGAAYGTVSILRPLIARELLGGRNFGAKSGALALPYLAGSAIAPFLVALIWLAGGYDLVLILAAGIVAIAIGLYALARHAA